MKEKLVRAYGYHYRRLDKTPKCKLQKKIIHGQEVLVKVYQQCYASFGMPALVMPRNSLGLTPWGLYART